MMEEYFTRVGATVLGLAGVLHLIRILTRREFEDIIPLWLSAVLVIVILTILIQYVIQRDDIRPGLADMRFYYLTILVFSAAFLLHTYRLLVDAHIISIFPYEASFFAMPLAFGLAMYNYALSIE